MDQQFKNVHRSRKENNFVMIDNRVFTDKRLSWKAKGILGYLFTRPDTWVFIAEEIMSHSPDGKAGFRSGWDELKKYGYVRSYPVREGNRISHWRTVIFEEPLDDIENSLDSDFQDVENCTSSKSDTNNTDLLSNTEQDNKNLKILTPKREKRTYSEDDSYYQMAKFLHDEIIKTAEANGKAHLVQKADLQKWADEFRKMVEIDGRKNLQEIREVIEFATTDSFWQTNILSAKKLREKYATLAMKAAQKPVRTNNFAVRGDDQRARLKQKILGGVNVDGNAGRANLLQD